jgi:diadenosine tetraphosphatase ApaH/serine/threonine PP2A family protein phosphatase
MEGGRTFACGQLRCIANPGSVGQPRDRNPQAAYLLLDLPGTRSEPGAGGEETSGSGPTFEWRRVPYDIAKVQEEMRRVGLPVFLSERLALGV